MNVYSPRKIIRRKKCEKRLPQNAQSQSQRKYSGRDFNETITNGLKAQYPIQAHSIRLLSFVKTKQNGNLCISID